MARKDLSRTVIEGGRYYNNSWTRRASHGIERATTRAWLDRIALDLDDADATIVATRPHVFKDFRDKLAPAYRWLVSQIDRPWSKVYAELCARFDTRTVAGRHVVHDHMLRWVRREHEPIRYYGRYDLVIDAHGVLRRRRWLGRSYEQLHADLQAWSAGRVCALTYRGWWWFRREGVGAPCSVHGAACSRATHHELAGMRYHAMVITADRPMSRRQIRRLASLPESVRAWLVIASPWPAR